MTVSIDSCFVNENNLFFYIEGLVGAALSEDVATGDITAALINSDKVVGATIITRDDAVICGVDCVTEVFKQVDPSVEVVAQVADGEEVCQNQVLFELKGRACSLLTGERVALNFLQMLSATATVTRSYVTRIQHTKTKILDTRKTIPGFRYLQKYAVKCGGGMNHRFGLFDAFLIKENHIAACGSIALAVEAAKQMNNGCLIEVEVESIDELQQAINSGATRVMLDNFDIDMVKQAVEINQSKLELEVSGNINLDTLVAFAEAGVDYISIGGLTKNIQAVDLSMRVGG